MLKLSWCTIHIPSGTVIDVAFQYGMDETLQGQIKYSFLLIIISHHQVESMLDVRLVSISTGCCITSQLSRYIVLQGQLQHLYNHLCYARILSITSISIILLALYHIQPKNARHNRPQTERNVTILCIVFFVQTNSLNSDKKVNLKPSETGRSPLNRLANRPVILRAAAYFEFLFLLYLPSIFVCVLFRAAFPCTVLFYCRKNHFPPLFEYDFTS